MSDNIVIECSKCKATTQLSYTYHQRTALICEPCRSKVSNSRTNGVFLPPIDKKQQKWYEFAKEKNKALASKYSTTGDRL